MSDARGEIGKALESKMSQEKIDMLLDEILASTKQQWAACPACKKRSLFEIPDANAVTNSIIKLMDQSWGRPDVAQSADEDRIVFERVVWMTDEFEDARGPEPLLPNGNVPVSMDALDNHQKAEPVRGHGGSI